MSWQRDYVFFAQADCAHINDWWQEEENATVLSFKSRSDVFGVLIRIIIQQFPDLTALDFFQERTHCDLEFTTQTFTQRFIIFDTEQQKQVIVALDKFFIYAQAQEAVFVALAGDFDSDPYDQQLNIINAMTAEDFDPYEDNDDFVTAMLIMRLIKEFFEQALEQKLYVGYYDYIP